MIKQQYCTLLFKNSPLGGTVGPSVTAYVNMTKPDHKMFNLVISQ